MFFTRQFGRAIRRRFYSSSSPDGMYRYVKLGLRTVAAKSAASAIGTVLLSPIGYSYYLEYRRNNNIDRSFNQGVGAKFETMEIPRDDVVGLLTEKLTPTNVKGYRGRYIAITGSRGTGKTTAVRTVVDSIGEGVIYFSIPDTVEEFSKALGDTIGFEYDEVSIYQALGSAIFRQPIPSYWTPEDPLKALHRWLIQFEAGAERYRQKSGKVPTIIIDNVNFLTNEDNGFKESLGLLARLQDKARTWTNDKDAKVVFVSSTGNAVLFMQGRPAWSRCAPPIEIGDVSYQDAMDYLRKNGIDEKVAARCIQEITGRRVSLLKEVATSLSEGKQYEELKLEMMTRAKSEFSRAGISNKAKKEYIRSVIKALVYSENGELDVDSPVLHAHGDHLFFDLLHYQVIAHHAADESVTFESQLASTYATDNIQGYE